MAVHEPHQRTLPELIKTVKALRIEESPWKKTAQLAITLGLTLKEAKERKPENVSWPDFVKEHFDFGQSRADALIRLADEVTNKNFLDGLRHSYSCVRSMGVTRDEQ
jgi:hypothetical protein